MIVCDTAWLLLSNMMGMPEMETKHHMRDLYKRYCAGKLDLGQLSESVFNAFSYYQKHRDLIDAGHS
ncbi:hypothetical protein [Muricauda sp. MAR_2010_75]|uniref:hypothetical protein n=1 Tax=Allomuricauda sp. MAR_2010_75 TaxID=1250232 RepID=UPI00055E225E|nr:hypothetical protein [Muricauda sp. MAR_2010_75]